MIPVVVGLAYNYPHLSLQGGTLCHKKKQTSMHVAVFHVLSTLGAGLAQKVKRSRGSTQHEY